MAIKEINNFPLLRVFRPIVLVDKKPKATKFTFETEVGIDPKKSELELGILAQLRCLDLLIGSLKKKAIALDENSVFKKKDIRTLREENKALKEPTQYFVFLSSRSQLFNPTGFVNLPKPADRLCMVDETWKEYFATEDILRVVHTGDTFGSLFVSEPEDKEGISTLTMTLTLGENIKSMELFVAN